MRTIMENFHLEIDGKPVDVRTEQGTRYYDDPAEAFQEALWLSAAHGGKPVVMCSQDGTPAVQVMDLAVARMSPEMQQQCRAEDVPDFEPMEPAELVS